MSRTNRRSVGLAEARSERRRKPDRRGRVLVMQLTASRSLQPADIERMMDRDGAKKTLEVLFEDDRRWDRILTSIAKGQPAWLNVAVNLKAVSDAGASERLAMATQEALPKNAPEVLRLVSRGAFDVDVACSGYGFDQIENERPIRVLLGLVDKRVAVVSRIRAPLKNGH